MAERILPPGAARAPSADNSTGSGRRGYGGFTRDASIGTIHQRGAVRRVAPLRCEAVSLERYSMLGTKVLDISETGMLLAAEGDPGDLRDLVLVHLFDGASDVALQAEVARVLRGRRSHDRGVALGLAFTRAGGRAFRRLMGRLRGTPPPVPRRPLRRHYASAVAAIARGASSVPRARVRGLD